MTLEIFDYCALTMFVLEIIIKWIDGFWVFWENGWNIFDFFVTVMVSGFIYFRTLCIAVLRKVLYMIVDEIPMYVFLYLKLNICFFICQKNIAPNGN